MVPVRMCVALRNYVLRLRPVYPCSQQHGRYIELPMRFTPGWAVQQDSVAIPSRFYHVSSCVNKKKTVNAQVSSPLPAINPSDSVHVIGEHSENLGVMTKKEADDLAHKKHLKLVLLENPKGALPIFMVMTGKQLTEERLRTRKEKHDHKHKDIKTLKVTSKITQHDLEVKINHMLTWLAKGHHIQAHIHNAHTDNDKLMNRVFEQLTTSAKHIGTVKLAKRTAVEITCHIKPIADSHTDHPVPRPLKTEELQKKRKSKEES